MMEALVWTGPREMAIRPEPVPVPGVGEVLVAVAVAGICGSEISGFLGLNKLRVPPLVMGHEASGRVTGSSGGKFADGSAVRDGVRVTFNPLVTCGECDRCRAGKPNLCRKRALIGVHRPGGYAQFVAVPARQCWPLKDGVSDTAGALAEPLACAVRAVSLAGIGKGDRLLVVGAGIIGLGCLLVAREKGAKEVIVSDRDARRLEVAKRWGASRTVNAGSEDLAVVLREAASGGVETAIDAVGSAATRAQCIQGVVPGGRAVFIGLHEEESNIPVNYLVRQEVSVTGCFAYSPEDFGSAVGMLERGVMKPEGYWLEERPLADGKEAFTELADGKCAKAKLVLRVGASA